MWGLFTMADKTASDNVKALLAIAKSIDPSVFQDLKLIESTLDNGALKTGVPSEAEIVTGPAIAARGGDIQAQITRTSDFVAQEGTTADYQRLSAMLTEMKKSTDGNIKILAKALDALVSGIAKAGTADKGDDVKDEDKKEFEKALRKARVAIRKAAAEDKDEAEDGIAKANAHIAAAGALISKAEDEVDSDDDEKEWMKSRDALQVVKGQLAAVVKAKAPPAVAAPVVVAKAEDAPVDEVAALAKSVEEMKMTMKDFFSRATGGPLTSSIGAPPVFAKASVESLQDILLKADAAVDAGTLTDGAFAKCTSIVSHLRAAQAGKLNVADVQREISDADAAVQAIFAPLMAAA